MLGIGRTKLYALIKRGELKTIKLGGSVLITMTSLEAFVQRCADAGLSGRR
ncbi:helix-turn-helix domain-containing protein [Sphingobium sp. 15-1]|uniref:helix-turn-helix domain-containing protein n=1 Tax=Sphingobium sp. 15-1 TaxID=2729616 RepID=UPI002101C400|nr:helix-turn-helix domain-containing protein [Sphingobium sp. 15-1]